MRIRADQETGGVPHVTGSAKTVALVLEDVLRGRTPTRIARERAIPESVVIATRDAHGYPHAAKVRGYVADLIALGEQKVTFPVPTGTHHAPRSQPVNPTPDPTPTPTPPPTGKPADLPLEQLLKHAASHDLARIRNSAAKIAALVERVRADLRADEERAAERARQAEEQARVDAAKAKERARIAELRAELARLTGRKNKRVANADGLHECAAGCGRTFDTAQGVAMHETRTHRAKAAS